MPLRTLRSLLRVRPDRQANQKSRQAKKRFRRLLGEPLESRLLLAGVLWDGEGEPVYLQSFTPLEVSVALAAASDTGISDSDRITSDNTPTILVTLNQGGSILVEFDGDGGGPTDREQVVATAGTYAFTSPMSLSDRLHTIKVLVGSSFVGSMMQSLDVAIETAGLQLAAGNAVGASIIETSQVLPNIYWDGEAGDGLWTSALNWSGNFVPGPNDDVLIDVPGDAIIRVRGSVPEVKTLANHETIWLEGRSASGFARLSVSQSAVNHGVIRMETTSNSTFGNENVYRTMTSGTLTNAVGGRIEVLAGAGESRFLTGRRLNGQLYRCDRHGPETFGSPSSHR